jgi:translation initiation factor IF-3
VCRILDFGKYAYEQTKKDREARKKQKTVEIKTIRLTPRTDDYHIEIGVRNARKWLAEGKKVKFMVRFKSREISYPEIGQKALQDIAEQLSDVAIVEQQPTLEGWRMTLTMSPEIEAAKTS